MTPGLAARALHRLTRSLTTWPIARDWLECALAAILMAVLGVFGFATGLLHWRPQATLTIVQIAALALFIPALGEEAVFRGPWLPARGESVSGLRAILVSTIAFTLWHAVETLWLPKAAALFLRWDFLTWAATLGFVCAVLRRRSGSLWPAVLLHWLAVVVWQGWLGGPGVAALR